MPDYYSGHAQWFRQEIDYNGLLTLHGRERVRFSVFRGVPGEHLTIKKYIFFYLIAIRHTIHDTIHTPAATGRCIFLGRYQLFDIHTEIVFKKKKSEKGENEMRNLEDC